MTGMKKTVSLALAFLLALYLAMPAMAAETAAVMKLTKTQGTVTVSKSNGKEVSLRADLRLYNGYNVTTGSESYAWINLDSAKLMKLDASTSVEVRKNGSKLEVNVKSGSVSFDVSEKLSSGESLNVSTSTMAVGIRGTCGWVRVTDQWVTETCLLEGRAQCVVEDPVTSQLKSAWLTGGDTAQCVVYPQEKPGDKCDILIERQTTGGIPGFVLSELVQDVPLCDKILDDSGLDVLSDLASAAGGDPSGRSPDGASASPEVLGLTGRRLKQEEAEQKQKQEEILKDVEQQENNISKDPVWEEGQQPSAPNDGGGSSGGSAQPAAPTAVTRAMPLTSGELQALLNQYNSVTVQPGAGAGENTLDVSSALDVPAGKTLTLRNGVGVDVRPGQTLNVDGTMHVDGGSLSNSGTVRVTSGDTLWVKGDFSGYGTVEVTATGKLVADGRFDRPGTFLLERGARVLAGAFDFTDFPVGWEKTGPDAGGYYFLEFSDTVYTVAFDSQGGSAVASAQVIPGGNAAMPEEPARTGCTFAGWYREEACENAWDFDADAVTEDVTLYAKWLGYSYANGALTVSDDAAMADRTWESAQGYDASALESVTILDGVTVIKDLAFAGCDSLTSVDIPGSVTEIASGAFMGCSRLAAVTIPDSVETIGMQAFSFCDSLTDVTVPASVTNMADAVFLGCAGLNNVAIRGSLESIEHEMFSGCTSLTSVDIPGSVTEIGYSTFSRCDSLKDIYYGNERDEWKKLNYTLPESVTVHCTDGDTPCFVTFDSQDGSEALRRPVGGDYRVLYPADPVREGYIFIDWYKEPACENAWDNYDRVEKDMTLYAKWTPVYTVAFDANGGTVDTATATTNTDGKLTSLPTPERDGYTFDGWFTTAESGNQVTVENKITEDSTVYAHWTIKHYIVKFYSQNSEIGSQDVNYGEKITPPSLTLDGYTLGGWYKDKDCSDGEKWDFDTDTVPANDITLYAKWTLNQYTVTFNSQGGSNVASVQVGHGNTVTKPDDPSQGVYTFDGWYTDAACTTAWNFDTGTVNGNMTLYAKWTPFTITFNTNGLPAPTTNPAPSEVDANGKLTSLPSLASGNANCEFSGWYTDPTGGVEVTANTVFNEDKTVYAHWRGWELNGTELRIYGQGKTFSTDYSSDTRPWEAHKETIITAKIEDGVTNIGPYAFESYKNLDSVVIADSVISIGQGAFRYSGLSKVNIPASVTSIGDRAFAAYEQLTEITVDADNPSFAAVDNVLFSKDMKKLIQYPGGSANTSYSIPSGVTTIDGAFYYCRKLTSVTIPTGVTSIGEQTFMFCGIRNIDIPEGVTTIGSGAFTQSSLITANIPASVTSISDNAFSSNYSLQSITVADGNPNYCTVDGVLFNGDKTQLICYPMKKTDTSYGIPDGVQSIAKNAFSYAASTYGNLTSVTIPSSVTSIESQAFYNSDNLTTINFSGTQAQWNGITINSSSGLSGKTVRFSDGTTATIP